MSNTERAPEPTMDEILASIRRIIAEDDATDAASQAGAEASEGAPDEDVFDLTTDQIADPAAVDDPEPLDLVNEVGVDEGISDAPEHAADMASHDIDDMASHGVDAALPLDVGEIVEEMVEERVEEVETREEEVPEGLASLMEAVADQEAAPEESLAVAPDEPSAPEDQGEGDYDAISSVDQLLAELKQRQSEAEAGGEEPVADAAPEAAAEATELPEQEPYEIESADQMESADQTVGAVGAADPETGTDGNEEGAPEAIDEAFSEDGARSFDDPLEAALANLASGLEDGGVAADEAAVEAEAEAASPPEIILGAERHGGLSADDDLADLEDRPAARVAEELEALSEVDDLAQDADMPPEEGAEVPAEPFASEIPEDHGDLHAAEGAEVFDERPAEGELGEYDETHLAEDGAEQIDDMPAAEASEAFEEVSAADDLRELAERPFAEGAEEAQDPFEGEAVAELDELAAVEDAQDVELTEHAEPLADGEPSEPVGAEAAPIAAAAVAAAATAAGNGLAEESPAAVGARHAPTLEDSVKELLRPMLQQWLDANMPQIVESVVREQMSAADQSDEAS